MVLLAVSSMLMTQQYKLHKVSLNRSTYKTRLCIDESVLMKGLQEPSLMFPQEQRLSIC